jgi:hypothetical protein
VLSHVRKLTRLDQTDIDAAAAQLEAEGLIIVVRTYSLAEE